MERNAEIKSRLLRCRNCTKPTENGGCPGNCGFGCIGDWRCCREIADVCAGCTGHGARDEWYCENERCPRMEKYRENVAQATTIDQNQKQNITK